MENDSHLPRPLVVAALGIWAALMTIMIGAGLAALLLSGCGQSMEHVTGPVTDATIAVLDMTPASSVAPSTPDQGGVCPADMVSLPGFCIDIYEAPNQKGVKPLAMQTAPDGEAWCEQRGKRLCSESEWIRACQGPNQLPYPYGTTYVRGKCDDDKTWIAPNWTTLGSWPSPAAMAEAARLYQADASGSRPGCVSAEGVYNLTGNVAEWVASTPGAHPYSDVMKGCYWSGCYGGSPPSCSFTNPAHPGTFRTYEGGFRCCKTT